MYVYKLTLQGRIVRAIHEDAANLSINAAVNSTRSKQFLSLAFHCNEIEPGICD